MQFCLHRANEMQITELMIATTMTQKNYDKQTSLKIIATDERRRALDDRKITDALQLIDARVCA